ncbi:MAG: glycosyltransferase, partial [Candidatus Eiseniibacteriota bacterium]
MDLSVVIVNYRSRDDLLSCLSRLPDAARGLETEVVVVDNASEDGAGVALAKWHPNARFIQNLENVGYSRAVNQGLRATRGQFAMILNPDCELHAGAARRLVDYLRTHPRTGIAAPRILNSDGTLEYSVRSYPDQYTFLFN